MKEFKWDPSQPRLAAVTGGPALYFWTPLGALVGRVPPVSRGEMGGLLEVRWNPRSARGALALSNRWGVVVTSAAQYTCISPASKQRLYWFFFREQTVLCRLKKEDAPRRQEEEDCDDNDDLDLEPSRERDSS